MLVSMLVVRNIFYVPIPTRPAIHALVFLKPRRAIVSYCFLLMMNS